jgi:hypothetical protein
MVLAQVEQQLLELMLLARLRLVVGGPVLPICRPRNLRDLANRDGFRDRLGAVAVLFPELDPENETVG